MYFPTVSTQILGAFLLSLQSCAHCKYDPSQTIEITKSVKPEYIVDFPGPVSFHLEAVQGGYPLLGLTVTAKIERPSDVKPFFHLALRDDGRYPDNKVNDGIYSAQFIDYTTPDRYSWRFDVCGKLLDQFLSYLGSGTVVAPWLASTVEIEFGEGQLANIDEGQIEQRCLWRWLSLKK